MTLNIPFNPDIKSHPVTIEQWDDFEKLFGERGACGGCWCMLWRLKRSEFDKRKGRGNKKAMRKIVNSGEVPGIICYLKNEPIAWCSVAPREQFPALERSRIFKRIDDKTVWSIVCLFIDKKFRRKGVSTTVIEAAVKYAEKNGALIIESYPFDPKKELPGPFIWTGVISAYRKAGFVEAARRSKTRPIMRYHNGK